MEFTRELVKVMSMRRFVSHRHKNREGMKTNMTEEQIECAIRAAAQQRERNQTPDLFKGIISESTAAVLLSKCAKPLDIRASLVCAARDPQEMLRLLRPIITGADGEIFPCLVEIAEKEINRRRALMH